MTTKRSILITGGAGRIGQFITNQWRSQYAITLTDIKEPAHTHGFPFVSADLSDFDAVQSLCRGMDTIVHLGADPRMEAPWESLLPNNVISTYNVFEAARLAGCRRVIFASSVNAVFGYPADVQVHTDMPIYPINLYGATKCWGEAVARYYAHTHGLSAICLRFGAVSQRPGPQSNANERYRLDHPYLDIILTLEDLTQLVAKSIEAPDDLRYGVYHGVSNNRWKRLDIDDARHEIGYEPVDDAFVFAGAA
ncbi:MAG: NAD(P)-dependent oxidoreductase [Caldilineaceae bacterium]